MEGSLAESLAVFRPGARTLDLGFEFRNRQGVVAVQCGPVVSPTSIGLTEDADGFPVCFAKVRYPAEGYNAFFGWVQLVKSTDNLSQGKEFEIDPFYILEDSPSPYAFYGALPMLFDAPSRSTRVEMQWTAHSFLAVTPFDQDLFAHLHNRRVVPIVGFSWGFEIDSDRRILIRSAEPLARSEWSSHLPLLRRLYSTWRFADWIDEA